MTAFITRRHPHLLPYRTVLFSAVLLLLAVAQCWLTPAYTGFWVFCAAFSLVQAFLSWPSRPQRSLSSRPVQRLRLPRAPWTWNQFDVWFYSLLAAVSLVRVWQAPDNARFWGCSALLYLVQASLAWLRHRRE